MGEDLVGFWDVGVLRAFQQSCTGQKKLEKI